MSERDASTMQIIWKCQGQAEMCAHQMRLNALYIQRELPNVCMSDELRRRTDERCTGFIGTGHKLLSELVELDDLLQTGASNVEVLRRINRMVQWAGEDTLKMHEIVMALDAELQKGVMDGGAYLLVSESAVNILTPLHEMRQLAGELGTALK
jgi:hypothetical protein